jgi:CubicO group peptidase (beta-lactamase class C family)
MQRVCDAALTTIRRQPLWVLLVLCLIASSCMFDGDLKHDTGVVPEKRNDGWEIDTPENVGLSSKALDQVHRQLLREDRYRGALSFLVIKGGKLVFETYLRRRSDQSQYRNIQSATKSVTSLLFGIAQDQGAITSLDLTVEDLFPDKVAGLDRRKRNITLRQLLTMTSGISFDNDVFSVEMWVERPKDPIRYILEKPLYANPGKKFYYRDMDPQLIGYAMTRLLGKSERELADETLFKALDIHDYYWEADPDGANLAAHGLQMLPRDLAKLGQLVLDRGLWRGERVVSEEWIETSTSAQIDSDTPFESGVFPYGYYWWIVPDVGYSMWGHGGQFVLVVPSQDLVLVQTAFPDTDLPDTDLQDFIELVRPLLQ